MSDTPRTDKVASFEGSWDTKAFRMTGFAENLERELAELRELFSKSLKERESTEKEVNAMLERVIAAEKQRDALADALELSMGILAGLIDLNEDLYDLVVTATNKETGEENKMSVRKALENSIAILTAVKGGDK